MSLENQLVRLFPSSHISSDREAELRATSALMSMLCAVNEFGREVTKDCGAPAGKIRCYSEVAYSLEGSKGTPPVELRPDGTIVVSRGKRSWKALLEVKVGDAQLEKEQVDSYHKLAKQEGFDGVVTISNQAAAADGTPPVSLDGRRLRSVAATHFSWERLLSEAQTLGRKKAVSDPDQEWMLNEWIRYISDAKSRIVTPPDLGPDWGFVVKAARTGPLVAKARETVSVASKWRAYLMKVALRLRAKLGAEVAVKLSRDEKNDCDLQVARISDSAAKYSSFSGTLKVKGAAGELDLAIYPGSKSAKFSIEFGAPTDGRQATRLNWLAKQLRKIEMPTGTTVEVSWSSRGLSTKLDAGKFAEAPDGIGRTAEGVLIPKDIVPKKFKIEKAVNLRTGRGKSSAPILEGLSMELERFYEEVVENITPYSPAVPKLVNERDLSSDQQPVKTTGSAPELGKGGSKVRPRPAGQKGDQDGVGAKSEKPRPGF